MKITMLRLMQYWVGKYLAKRVYSTMLIYGTIISSKSGPNREAIFFIISRKVFVRRKISFINFGRGPDKEIFSITSEGAEYNQTTVIHRLDIILCTV